MIIFSRWLIRRLFPHLPDVSDETLRKDPSIRTKVGTFEGGFAVIINLILFAIKLMVGITIHSIALIADAFHTLADSVSSFIIIVGFTVSKKPADVEHPYGHGRAEYISTLILSLMIVVTGVEFIRSSVGLIYSPSILQSTPLMIGIVLGTVVVKEIMARISANLGFIIDSDMLKADAWHHRSDVFSSLAPIVSMVLANAGKEQWDGILGIVVGLFIIWIGFTVGRKAIDSLLGIPPGPQLVKKIRSLSRSMEGIIDVHSIIVHSYGIKRFISLHMEVDQDKSQIDSHKLAGRVRDRLKEGLHANVIVHVDPVTTRGEEATQIKQRLAELVDHFPGVDSFHDFRIVDREDHRYILVKLAVETGLSEREQRGIQNLFSDKLRIQFPEFENRVSFISSLLS